MLIFIFVPIKIEYVHNFELFEASAEEAIQTSALKTEEPVSAFDRTNGLQRPAVGVKPVAPIGTEDMIAAVHRPSIALMPHLRLSASQEPKIGVLKEMAHIRQRLEAELADREAKCESIGIDGSIQISCILELPANPTEYNTAKSKWEEDILKYLNNFFKYYNPNPNPI